MVHSRHGKGAAVQDVTTARPRHRGGRADGVVVVTALAAVDEDARAEASRGPMCHRRPAHFSTRSRVDGFTGVHHTECRRVVLGRHE
jgi:hypothetical protein